MKKSTLKGKLGIVFAKIRNFSNELQHLAGRIFCKRRIIVISERSISSIPASSKSQGLIVTAGLLMLLWISYSTGKYVTYESVISQKDREIWNTNITNEGLQYQMADLHQNLSDLNKYFENIRQLDLMSQKSPVKSKASDTTNLHASNTQGEKVADNNASADPNGVQQILTNIRSKVISRIENLEAILQMTGLNLRKIADNNTNLKAALLNASHLHADISNPGDVKNQGGPYVSPGSDLSAMFSQEEFESEINYLMQLEKFINSVPLSTPLKEYRLTSGFGRRMDPLSNEGGAIHTGIDIAAEYKSKVYSSAPGVVSFADSSGAYGRLVRVEHGSGISTWYGHLDRILVREGETVKRGQLIALQGNTGRSTGTHLHYEVRLNNQPINPANFLEAGKYVF